MSPRAEARATGACRVCGGAARAAFTARERMIGTRESFDYVECLTCGCLQIAPLPDEVELERFYPADYYTTARVRTPIRPRSAGLRLLARLSTGIRLGIVRRTPLRFGARARRIDWLARTGTGLDDAILDIGCGTGRLLARLHRAGFSRLTGIDTRLPLQPEDGGLRADTRDFRRRDEPALLCAALEDHSGRYRLVMAHHSFEHVRDPGAAFDAFARLVQPGGWLLVRTPRADGEPRRRYAESWVQVDAPRHLHLHTQRSIEHLASQSGFRLVSVEDDSGPFQIWGSELYRRDIALSEAGRGGREVFSPRERLGFRWQARALRRAGRGDQACFYLRRDSDADGSGSITAGRSGGGAT